MINNKNVFVYSPKRSATLREVTTVVNIAPSQLFQIKFAFKSMFFTSCTASLSSISDPSLTYFLYQCFLENCFQTIDVFLVDGLTKSNFFDNLFGKEFFFKLNCKIQLTQSHLDDFNYQYGAKLIIENTQDSPKESFELTQVKWNEYLKYERFFFGPKVPNDQKIEVGILKQNKICLLKKKIEN
ncbi:hypothetical protein HMI55_003120 [Coelomomyces lativittatus]|nr:hypothetical protein HMI55_003120 [Coelomomyces lativittatus]KAJ1507384.1 hypothetical protein HMI56_000125 [Coelomomyces lativittatus]